MKRRQRLWRSNLTMHCITPPFLMLNHWIYLPYITVFPTLVLLVSVQALLLCAFQLSYCLGKGAIVSETGQ